MRARKTFIGGRALRSVGAFGVVVAFACLAAPVASYSDPASTAVDACVKSFIEAYFTDDRVVRVRKRLEPTGSLHFTYPQPKYTIALTARGTRSREILAQARCVAGARGNVIILDSPPLDTYLAKAHFSVTIGR